MIQAKLIDGTTIEVAREDACEFLPYQGLFFSPMLRAPVEAVLCHRGKAIPVLGPLPDAALLAKPALERPWLLVLKGYAQVVVGLPVFGDEAASHNVIPFSTAQNDSDKLLDELDELLKTA